MGKVVLVVLLLVAALGTAGWHYRARIAAAINPPPSAEHPAEKPDVLYTWVDKNDVTHYEQKSGKGTRVEYDGSRITPVPTVGQDLLARSEIATPANKPGSGSAEEKATQDSQSLSGLRKKLQENAQQMRDNKAATEGL